MTDLRMRSDGASLDLVLEAGDLALDETFETPLLVSLFTDALARAEDPLPDDGEDRRGWWAEALQVGEDEEHWGSRLWLLQRATLTTQTLGDAEVYAREGLDWLLERGVVGRVDVVASRLDLTVLLLEVLLVRGEATQRAELWEGTERLQVAVGPSRLSVLAIP